MLSETAQQIIVERESGETLKTIAHRHGLSHQRVSTIVKDGRSFVDHVERDLLVARTSGEVCAFVIPFGPNYTTAMRFGDWLIARLRARDLNLHIETRRASNGLALLLTDITDYRPGGKT